MSNFQSQKEEQELAGAADDLSSSPVAAAILAAGVGCCVLGILAVIGDGSAAAARCLTFYLPTGPLSGVTITAILVWLAVWSILARLWRSKLLPSQRSIRWPSCFWDCLCC
jgi:hypothetical protein